MKKLLVLLFVCLFSITAFGQTIDFDVFQDAFDSFASEIAPSVPILANVGLQWSDSWIGGLPHFGVGVTVGTAFVPKTVFTDVYDILGQSSDALSDIPDIGLPLPAVSGEARIGGLILPFDVGMKFGMIPPFLADMAGSTVEDVEYQMVGFDVRYRLLKEGILKPEVSVGVGYTYLKTNLGMSMNQDIEVGSWQVPVGTDGGGNVVYEDYTMNLTDPSADFGWTSSIIDFKAQISKSLLILKPYLGAGVSLGISSVGGGVSAEPVITDGTDNYTVDEIRQRFEYYGVAGDFPDIDDTGISFYGDYVKPSFRIYGGTSVSILLFKVDISGTINPVTRAFGAQLNARIQL